MPLNTPSSFLQHTPAKIVAAVLYRPDVALGSDPLVAQGPNDWPVFASRQAPQPDRQIVVYSTQGRDEGRTMPDGELAQHHGLQFRVSARIEDEGWAKINAIRRFLSEGVSPIGTPGTGPYFVGPVTDEKDGGNPATYLLYNFANIGQTISLGTDMANSMRRIFTLNAMVVLRQLM